MEKPFASVRPPAPNALLLPQERREELLNKSIGAVFPPRTTTILESGGLLTVRDILLKTPDELLTIRLMGGKTLDEVYRCLENIGFYRKGKEPSAPKVSA